MNRHDFVDPFIYNDTADKYYVRNGRAFKRVVLAYSPGHAICLALKQIGYLDSTEISKNVLPLMLFTVDTRGFRGYNEEPKWKIATTIALEYFDRWMMGINVDKDIQKNYYNVFGDGEFLNELEGNSQENGEYDNEFE